MASAAIEMPTMGGVQKNLMSYGVGVVAGLGYNIVSNITGSGLIGGAVSAAVAGSLVRGVIGEVIAVNAGFNVGQRGMGGLGLGNLGGFGRNGNATNGAPLAIPLSTI